MPHILGNYIPLTIHETPKIICSALWKDPNPHPHLKLFREIYVSCMLFMDITHTKMNMLKTGEASFLALLDAVVACKSRIEDRGIHLPSAGSVDRIVTELRPLPIEQILQMPEEQFLQMAGLAMTLITSLGALFNAVKKEAGISVIDDP